MRQYSAVDDGGRDGLTKQIITRRSDRGRKKEVEEEQEIDMDHMMESRRCSMALLPGGR